jgi:hypothetical protein
MGVSLYPVVSLLVFTLFFTGVMIWIIRMDKNEIKHLEQLPLND